MAVVNTGSDLLETKLTDQEINTAMQLKDTNLSVMYLQNTKVGIVRTLATQEFTDPAKDTENHRIRAYWKGQLDLLEQLIAGALAPTPVPLENPSSQTGA